MKISREQLENFTSSFRRAFRGAGRVPYSSAHRVYSEVIRSTEGKTIDDLAMASLVSVASTSVYFVACPLVGLIKIGKTINMRERIQTLQSMSPAPLELAYFIDFDDGLEGRLHEKFDGYRAHGEWFEAAPELIDFVRNTRDKGAEFLIDELGEGAANWSTANQQVRGIDERTCISYLASLKIAATQLTAEAG